MARERQRLTDANKDLNLSMDELREIDGETLGYHAQLARAVVRVIGSIAVTLAMMLDDARDERARKNCS